jgi:hypothetical protein
MAEPHHLSDDQEKIDKMVTMTVAAAKGLIPLMQVALPLAQISQSEVAPPAARDLARVLNRILKGERDPLALVETLTPAYAEVVWETLAQIDEPLPPLETHSRQPLTFEQLLEKVAEACRGEVLLWQQLWDFTAELSDDERLSPEVRALGPVLRKILAGERQPHILAELAEAHRGAVAELLDWLIAQAATPTSDRTGPN